MVLTRSGSSSSILGKRALSPSSSLTSLDKVPKLARLPRSRSIKKITQPSEPSSASLDSDKENEPLSPTSTIRATRKAPARTLPSSHGSLRRSKTVTSSLSAVPEHSTITIHQPRIAAPCDEAMQALASAVLKTPTKRVRHLSITQPISPPKTPSTTGRTTPLKASKLTPSHHKRTVVSPDLITPDVSTSPSPSKLASTSSIQSEAGNDGHELSIASAKAVFINNQSIYALARSALHSHSSITGRERERDHITNFLLGSAASLYIGGSPGAGKTACVRFVIKELEKSIDRPITFTQVYLNCMALPSPTAIWASILSELKSSGTRSGEPKEQVESLLSASSDKFLLVLDEIDFLPVGILNAVFSISQTHSNTYFIGISNTMSLVTSLSPALQNTVQQLQFTQYTVEDLQNIIGSQMLPRFADIIINPSVDLAARKVASISGDLRRAIDVMSNAIDLAEKEYRRNLLILDSSPVEGTTTLNLIYSASAPNLSSTQSMKQSQLVKVSPSHVLKAFNSLTKAKSAANTSGVPGIVKGLPMQSRLSLAAFMLSIKRQPDVCLSMNDLHARYMEIIERTKCPIKALPRTDFGASVNMLVDVGLLRIIIQTPSKRKNRKSEPVLMIDAPEQDLRRGLTDGIGPAESHIQEMIAVEERLIQRAAEALLRETVQSPNYVPHDVLTC